ncbi:beta-class carbonic anhydrase [Nocardia nova]|uniref:beta-class carbonic anhydrase n=1 Tax=Nocardia nova TaxID=37330 RepID=UPI0033C74A05
MSVIDEALKRNALYATNYSGSQLPRPPKLELAVIGCMDARINYSALLGLEDGDAIIITDAGGMVTEEILRSVTIAERGPKVREVMYIGHTDCGIATEDDKAYRDKLEAETGARPPWSIKALTDVDDYVRDSVETILNYPFITLTNVRGFVFDIETGLLREVENRDSAPGAPIVESTHSPR